MGVATIPGCFKGVICDLINGVVNKLVYYPIFQNNIGPAGYFKDPANPIGYIFNSSYLPIVNNERQFNISIQNSFADLDIV